MLMVSLRSLNATFITLILKITGSIDPNDFRPISLVSGIYKIIDKILANKLKTMLKKIISKLQDTFIQGRQILFLLPTNGLIVE